MMPGIIEIWNFLLLDRKLNIFKFQIPKPNDTRYCWVLEFEVLGFI